VLAKDRVLAGASEKRAVSGDVERLVKRAWPTGVRCKEASQCADSE